MCSYECFELLTHQKVLKNEHNGLSYYFTRPFKATRHLCLENTIFTFSYFVTIRTYNVNDFSSYESKICIRDIQLKGRYGGVWWMFVQFNTIQGRYRIVTYSGIGVFLVCLFWFFFCYLWLKSLTFTLTISVVFSDFSDTVYKCMWKIIF